jgi:hypothetical protein
MIHLFLKMARKVDEAVNFDFVQLNKQEPGIYMIKPPRLYQAGQNRFGLGKNFS